MKRSCQQVDTNKNEKLACLPLCKRGNKGDFHLKKIILLFVLQFAVSSPIFAAFKNLSSARAIGMGEAFSTLATEVSGLYWNPAGLGDLKAKEVSGMYSVDGLDTKYTFISYGEQLMDWGGAGFSWSRLSNEFEKTSDQETITGNGGVTNDEIILGAGYCRDLPVSLGLTAKFLQEKIDSFVVSGWSVNSGVLYEVEPVRFAFVIENIVSSGLKGNSVVSGTVEEKLPPTLRLGISIFGQKNIQIGELSKKPAAEGRSSPEMVNLRANFETDIVFPFEEPDKFVLNTGLEVWINKQFAMRTGFREMRDLTAGLSIKIKALRFDYALIFSRNLENSHVFSTSFFF